MTVHFGRSKPLPYRLIWGVRKFVCFSGCRGRHPLPQNFIVFRRGGVPPPVLCAIGVCARGLLPPLSRSPVSPRLGHTRVLTVHRTVIHFARAASLPLGGRHKCGLSSHLWWLFPPLKGRKKRKQPCGRFLFYLLFLSYFRTKQPRIAKQEQPQSGRWDRLRHRLRQRHRFWKHQ